MWIYLCLSAGLIVIDQWTKFMTVENLALGETSIFIRNFLSFTYIRNTGAAWSILEGQMWFFYTITTISIFVILYLFWRNIQGSRWLLIGLSLILAGAVGNFIDRIRLGFVVDMLQLDFIHFPIFNFADMCLTIGVFCVLIYLFLDERKNKV